MRPNLLLIVAGVLFLAFLYFMFLSKSSWQNYNKLEKKIHLLEQQVEQLTLEKSRLLQQISNKNEIETKEYYLNKKLIIRSNEMLVELQIPPLKNTNALNNKYSEIPAFLYILLLLLIVTILISILFIKRNKKE